jgi:micrococcal nuclease
MSGMFVMLHSKYLRFLIAFFAILLCAGHGFSAEYPATVTGISDGDTIKIMNNGVQERIRLYGIDCPEKGQPYGQAAKKFTMNAVSGKQVLIKPVSKDRYGRIVAWVFYDDKCLNKELLRTGLAWHYKKYSKDHELADIEVDARLRKAGLWIAPGAAPPWSFRRGQR